MLTGWVKPENKEKGSNKFGNIFWKVREDGRSQAYVETMALGKGRPREGGGKDACRGCQVCCSYRALPRQPQARNGIACVKAHDAKPRLNT